MQPIAQHAPAAATQVAELVKPRNIENTYAAEGADIESLCSFNQGLGCPFFFCNFNFGVESGELLF